MCPQKVGYIVILLFVEIRYPDEKRMIINYYENRDAK